MNDYLASHIRTFVPLVIGPGLAFLAKKYSIVISEETATEIVMAVGSGLGATFYALIRALAEKWGWFGYGLIVNRKPTYQLGK